MPTHPSLLRPLSIHLNLIPHVPLPLLQGCPPQQPSRGVYELHAPGRGGQLLPVKVRAEREGGTFPPAAPLMWSDEYACSFPLCVFVLDPPFPPSMHAQVRPGAPCRPTASAGDSSQWPPREAGEWLFPSLRTLMLLDRTRTPLIDIPLHLLSLHHDQSSPNNHAFATTEAVNPASPPLPASTGHRQGEQLQAGRGALAFVRPGPPRPIHRASGGHASGPQVEEGIGLEGGHGGLKLVVSVAGDAGTIHLHPWQSRDLLDLPYCM